MEIRATAGPRVKVDWVIIDRPQTGGRFPDAEGWISVRRTTMTDVTVPRRTFKPFFDVATTFRRCHFDRTRFRTGMFGANDPEDGQSLYVDCHFDRVRIDAGMQLGDVRFERCRFTDVKIAGWRGQKAEFVDCTFTGTLRDCWFQGSQARVMYSPTRTANLFTGNDFSGADLRMCQFDGGITIGEQRWPPDDDYVIFRELPTRIEAARRMVARWPDDRTRERALSLLRIFGTRMHEQDEHLYRRSDFMDDLPEARDALFDVLAGHAST